MRRFFTSPKNKAFFLLAAGICFFTAGIAILALGAIVHVNPKISFAGLFRLEPLVNLVYHIIY